MFILYKKKDILTFFADVKFSTDEQKKLFFLFWTFSFFIRILGFYFPSLVVLLVFLFLHFFFPSFPPPPTLSSHFFLSLQYKTPLFSLPHVFIFLFRALHPLTPPSSYTHWMWLGPFVLCLPPWQNIMIIIMAMMLMVVSCFWCFSKQKLENYLK